MKKALCEGNSQRASHKKHRKQNRAATQGNVYSFYSKHHRQIFDAWIFHAMFAARFLCLIVTNTHHFCKFFLAAGIKARGQMPLKIYTGKPFRMLAHGEKVTSKKGISTKTRMILDCLMARLADELRWHASDDECRKKTMIQIKPSDLAALRHTSFIHRERKDIRKAIADLKQIKLFWKEQGREHHMMLAANEPMPEFSFKFSFDAARYVTRKCLIECSPNIFRIDTNKNPHAYFFARRYFEIMNNRKLADKTKPIKVDEFLQASPVMPKLQQIQKGLRNRHWTDAIVKPFERDMNSLIDYEIIKGWNYVDDMPKDAKTLYKRRIIVQA